MTRPVLVLVHGGGTDARCWGAVRPGLARRFRVLAPDLPGHGDRPAPAAATVEALARPLAERIRAEVAGPYHLLGHSLGGMVATWIAANGPAPERLVLADTFDVAAPDARSWARVAAMGLGARLLGRARATRYVIEAQGLGTEGFDAALRASMLHEAAMPLGDMMAAVRRWDGRPHLDRLTMPVLLLMAGGHPATAAAGRRMEARLADARRVVMPEVGHMQMRDDPAGFVRAVVGFLEGSSPRPTHPAPWDSS